MEEWYQSNKVSFQRNRDCMVNYRNVSYALGVLVLVEAGFFALCAGVSFYYQEEDYIHFLETLLINVVLGGLLLLGGKRNEVSINRRDGYCIVSLSWILFSALGMLPFLFSGYIPSISDAFFETMSGFTTTGATILDHIETLPPRTVVLEKSDPVDWWTWHRSFYYCTVASIFGQQPTALPVRGNGSYP